MVNIWCNINHWIKNLSLLHFSSKSWMWGTNKENHYVQNYIFGKSLFSFCLVRANKWHSYSVYPKWKDFISQRIHIVVHTIIVKMPRSVTIHCHIFDRCAPGRIPQQIGSGASCSGISYSFRARGLHPTWKAGPEQSTITTHSSHFLCLFKRYTILIVRSPVIYIQ